MKFRLIDAPKKEFPVQRLRKILGVRPSGYFALRLVRLLPDSATIW